MAYSEREKRYLKAMGDRIRALRKERGLSQEELADECGLHRTYIGGVERGERNLSALNVVKIARVLKVPPGQILPD